jgi:hypothetical protein
VCVPGWDDDAAHNSITDCAIVFVSTSNGEDALSDGVIRLHCGRCRLTTFSNLSSDQQVGERAAHFSHLEYHQNCLYVCLHYADEWLVSASRQLANIVASTMSGNCWFSLSRSFQKQHTIEWISVLSAIVNTNRCEKIIKYYDQRSGLWCDFAIYYCFIQHVWNMY